MKGKADVNFGGAVAGGALSVNLKLADGHHWHFAGGYGRIGPVVEGGYGIDMSSDFPGLSHIKGDCAFEVLQGGLGPAGIQITFFDLHGQIGTVVGYVFGGGAIFGVGGGTWTDEAHVAAA